MAVSVQRLWTVIKDGVEQTPRYTVENDAWLAVETLRLAFPVSVVTYREDVRITTAET